MSDINESIGDTGYEAASPEPVKRYPDDATSAALITGFHEIGEPVSAERDDDALADRPQGTRLQLDMQPPENITLADIARQLVENDVMMVDVKLVPNHRTDEMAGEARRVPAQRAAEAPLEITAMHRKQDGAVDTQEAEDAPSEYELDRETSSRLRPEVIREANALKKTTALVTGDANERDDPYLSDAEGHARSILANATSQNAGYSADARVGAMRSATIKLTRYAACTGRDEAARSGFSTLTDAGKWLVYADAYETQGIDPKTIAEWRHDLDRVHEDGSEDQSHETQASRLFALTKGKLHDYTSTIDPARLAALREQQGLPAEGSSSSLSLDDLASAREEHKQAAIAYGRQLAEVVQAMRQEQTPIGDSMRRTWRPDEFQRQTTIAFARAGVWEGIEHLYGERGAKTANAYAQATRAAHGQLGDRERLQLRLAGDHGKMLRWLHDSHHGTAGDPPSINIDKVHSIDILEQVVPGRLQQLGLQPVSETVALQTALATGDMESVRARYTAILDRHMASVSLRASLDVSQHLYDVQATKAAHDVFENAVLDELAPVEAHVEAQYEPGFDGDFGEDVPRELDRVYAEVAKLKDPVTSLYAKARLATIYLKAEPNSQRVSELMTDIQTQWSVLERREGGDQELKQLYQSLRSAGMHVEPQWKQDGAGGFIGFRPTSELLVRRGTSNYIPFSGGRTVSNTTNGERVYTETADEMLRTAETLNELLGTERYRVEIDEEDMQTVQALRAHNAQRTSPYDQFPWQQTKHSVELTGPWRVLYATDESGCRAEFERAADNIRSVDRGYTMHSNTALTEHLRQLIDEAEAEWQKEQTAAA